MDKGKETRNQLVKTLDELNDKHEQVIEQDFAVSVQAYENSKNTFAIDSLIALMAGIGIISWCILSIIKSLKNVSSVMSGVAYISGDTLPRIEVKNRDELGEIAESFNEMAQALEEKAQREREVLGVLEEQNWLKTNINEVINIYQGVYSLSDICQKTINQLAQRVGASYGAFYFKVVENNGINLKNYAHYAGGPQVVGAENFRLGEGLVGQSAQENKIIYLDLLPENYIKITSGLGQAPAHSLVILPISFEDDVLGVIELASLQPLTELKKKFLMELVNNIGIAINRIKGQMEVERLLKESQALTEELQIQSEELRLQQEELTTINDKLAEQYEQSQQKAKELEHMKDEVEEKAHQLAITSNYKSEFLANMSHELRTPLNSLLILTQLLAQNDEGNLTAKQVEFAQTIHSAGNDLLVLINDILDLSKVESGKMEIVPEEVQLSEFKKFAETQFTELAQSKDLKLNVDLATNLPFAIYTDAHRVKQILKNLLSNAIKFTHQGSVAVTINRTLDNMITFSVQDTGIGIAEEKKALIFEAFHQGDGTTSRKFGGTGLGLSISRELANKLGGYIDLISIEGRGSTFTLYLPTYYHQDLTVDVAAATQSIMTDFGYLLDDTGDMIATNQGIVVNNIGQEIDEVESFELDDKQKSLLVDRKLLLVDDDFRNIFALTTALENFGLKIIHAENGQECLEVLQSNPDVELILMDIMMPVMDGYETIRTLRRMPEYQELPIIAITAKAMKFDREKCIEAGASDYISKPINLEQLISLMHVWLYK
ncbi:MAG: ATP-binding protein [Desulfitobacterium hafniense]|nr:ATP-binding protein [Desulfitobacterium hafniense]